MCRCFLMACVGADASRLLLGEQQQLAQLLKKCDERYAAAEDLFGSVWALGEELIDLPLVESGIPRGPSGGDGA